MSPRQRQHILDNLETVYREAYERAKKAGDERRMLDLDAAYQREQLLLEVLLDIRDSLTGTKHTPAKPTTGGNPMAAIGFPPVVGFAGVCFVPVKLSRISSSTSRSSCSR